MRLDDAYFLTYNTLNNYYMQNKNDSLASLLSDMDPNIFQDRKAADPATYEDWEMIVRPFIKNGHIECNEIMLALKKFLIYYQEEFGYDLCDAILYIDSKLVE